MEQQPAWKTKRNLELNVTPSSSPAQKHSLNYKILKMEFEKSNFWENGFLKFCWFLLQYENT